MTADDKADRAFWDKLRSIMDDAVREITRSASAAGLTVEHVSRVQRLDDPPHIEIAVHLGRKPTTT